MEKRIVVVGAGAVGGFIGAYLARSGRDGRVNGSLFRTIRSEPLFRFAARWIRTQKNSKVALVKLTTAFARITESPRHRRPNHSSVGFTSGIRSMLFVGAISTSIAYWLWGRLLRDYTAAQVVPFVGSAASTVVFGETFGPLRLSGMVIVVAGIAVMLLSKRPQDVSEKVLPKIA